VEVNNGRKRWILLLDKSIHQHFMEIGSELLVGTRQI
jgi:hypothetical protein